jgi:hypothetical protein
MESDKTQHFQSVRKQAKNCRQILVVRAEISFGASSSVFSRRFSS